MTTYIFVAQIQELFKLDSSVGERAERPLFLHLRRDCWVGNIGVSLCKGYHPASVYIQSSQYQSYAPFCLEDCPGDEAQQLRR